jgi:hypothetical protein
MSCVARLLSFTPVNESRIMDLFPIPAAVQAQIAGQLSTKVRVLLAKHQIRLPEREGGLSGHCGIRVSSMVNTFKSAFDAATVRFFDTPHGRMLALDSSSHAPSPLSSLSLPRAPSGRPGLSGCPQAPYEYLKMAD